MYNENFNGVGVFDAAIWADEFCGRLEAGVFTEIDFGLMVAWFANAIMAGYNEGLRRGRVQ